MSHYYGSLFKALTKFKALPVALYTDIDSKLMNLKLAETVPFFFPENTNDTLREVANNHWSMWEPVCPPFQHCFIEMEASVLDFSPEIRRAVEEAGRKRGAPFNSVSRIGFLIFGEYASLCFLDDKEALVSPIMISLKKTTDASPEATLPIWGLNYDKSYGDGSWPPYDTSFAGSQVDGGKMMMTLMRRDAVFEMDDQIAEAMVSFFAGCGRLLMAALAILNAPRASELALAKTPSGLSKGKIVKFPDLRLVVVKPNTPRKVYECARSRNEPANPKRLHDVRQHLRRYPSGKIVVVRSHQRGDEELGVVKKQYIVEDVQNG